MVNCGVGRLEFDNYEQYTATFCFKALGTNHEAPILFYHQTNNEKW